MYYCSPDAGRMRVGSDWRVTTANVRGWLAGLGAKAGLVDLRGSLRTEVVGDGLGDCDYAGSRDSAAFFRTCVSAGISSSPLFMYITEPEKAAIPTHAVHISSQDARTPRRAPRLVAEHKPLQQSSRIQVARNRRLPEYAECGLSG